LPKRYRDELPPAPLPVVADIPDLPELPAIVADLTMPTVKTQANEYGIHREYYGSFPSYDPSEFSSLSDLCNSPALPGNLPPPTQLPWWLRFTSSVQSITQQTSFAPFLNATTFRLMRWFYSVSNTKSLRELNRLVKDVILADDFEKEDLEGFSAEREVKRIDSHQDDTSAIFAADDGWITAPVPIHVPAKDYCHKSEEEAPVFEVKGLQYRKIVEVVKSALQEPSAAQYHLSPFAEFWTPSDHDPTERLYSEMYSSQAMIDEHKKINSHPSSDDNLENFVIAIMLWSDSTHLASFGNASLWPIYMFIGNLSKYVRNKPSAFAAHHIAYIPKVRRRLTRMDCALTSFHSSGTRFKTFTGRPMTPRRQQKFFRTASANLFTLSCYYSWTRNSWMRTRMVWSHSVPMVFHVVDLYVFLFMRAIIPKSAHLIC
jgi:Plavaka transposase